MKSCINNIRNNITSCIVDSNVTEPVNTKRFDNLVPQVVEHFEKFGNIIENFK